MKNRLLCLFLIAMLLCPLACASEAAFTVAAKGAVLIDGATGRILFAQNENEPYPIASTTKIMTALLALENNDISEIVTVGKNASGVEGTSIYLSVGEQLTLEHMLYGLMLRSGNDAAVAIAEHVGGSVPKFVEMMNKRAQELNADANFVNPNGLPAKGHQASALAMARIMRQALTIPEFRTITATKKKVIPWVGNDYSRVLENKNRLLTTYEGATGGKTGFTKAAGRCLVFSAKRDGMELIGVVINCPTWFDTATAMLNYGFENYRFEVALEPGQEVGHVALKNGSASTVSAVAAQQLAAPVAIGSHYNVRYDYEELHAPIRKGDAIGTASLTANGETLATCKLVAGESVPVWSFGEALRSILRNWALQFSS